ncbi:hypothetical protein K402DRAFT_399043 [Aulographum hederae CBS 113979]|uniref:Uncharacterized protein n=1 Tax=Aulographum hederae CBS 113979 TaxID=1176131 RepID=A0A6G1GJH5_9PEZI|nr:hypothetical protein K402DRAFT_399043 [Aulographum hederae CBS 113979]
MTDSASHTLNPATRHEHLKPIALSGFASYTRRPPTATASLATHAQPRSRPTTSTQHVSRHIDTLAPSPQ